MPNIVIPFDIPDESREAVLAEITELMCLTSIHGPLANPYWEEPQAKPIDKDLFKLPASGSQRQAVLLSILEGGKVRDEIAQELDSADSAVDWRVKELRDGEYVTVSSETKETRWGGRAHVLIPTDKAKRECRLAPLKWFPGNVRPDTCK